MKLKMMAALSVLMLTAGLVNAQPGWGGGYGRPGVSVRVFAPIPPIIAPPVPVVVTGNYGYGGGYRHHRPHYAQRYRGCDNNRYSYNNYNGYYDNGYRRRGCR